jgi:hypothetical protein
MTEVVISNEAFTMVLDRRAERSNLYVLQMLPVDAQQVHLDLLQSSLEMICNNALMRSSIVLDCSLLKQKGLVKRFMKLCFKKIIAIDNPAGLDKFIIVTTSTLVSVMSKSIIKLKRADHYTKICSSMEEALREV